MTKRHFIALADAIKQHNLTSSEQFNSWHLDALGRFCQSQNRNFKAGRWIGYIKGQCGSNGGKVKVTAEDKHAQSGCTDYLQHNAESCPLKDSIL